MVTAAKPEPKTETVTGPVNKQPVTGKRFIIWNPRLDPSAVPAPQRSVDVRPFAMSYIDQLAFALTPVMPGGGITPSFKTLLLNPGLNEVDCEEWTAAVNASSNYGQVRQSIDPSHSTADRLSLSSQHGVDPIQEQISAGAIVVPALTTDNPAGTIGDYSVLGVQQILKAVTDVLTLQSWLSGIAQGLIVHPEKRSIEIALKDAIAAIEGVS